MTHTKKRIIDYEHEMNAAQYEAVSSGPGPILVIAGAGSGKTRTIVYRVAWLVDHGVDPSSILLVTFTRKASQEMLGRAIRLLDDRIALVSGGTFHSVGASILRRYSRILDFDASFTILDQSDSHDAIDIARKELSPPIEDLKSFPKPRTISEIISRAAGTGDSIPDVIDQRCPHLEDYGPDIERVRLYYEHYKKSHHLMDYDDLLSRSMDLLETSENVRRQVCARWSHILVDEYQDTNRLQARMVRLLADGHDNVMAVGDDSQSIYSFRGADFKNIMRFPELFPGTRIIKLEENYRSVQPILEVANSIIERAGVGFQKRLFTNKKHGIKPLLARPFSEKEQSLLVLKIVQEFRRTGVPLNDIAVLFRAGFHSFDLEAELTKTRSPYVKYGGFKFVESAHIKDVLAHLRVMANKNDRISWARILKTIAHIGDKTAKTLASLFAEADRDSDLSVLVPEHKKYTDAVKELVNTLSSVAQMDGPLPQKIDELNRFLTPYLQSMYDNYPKRLRELEQLAQMSAPYNSLTEFLNDVAIEPPDHEIDEDMDSRERLTLSTIHSAKGLEWGTVIIIWAAEGRIPSPMSLGNPDDLEEERRLLYVAVTRAKERLIIVVPETIYDRRLGVVPASPSRFLEEIPMDRFATRW
ncbi:MAG: ATP-dependent helicase [Deltaproteobacteria bacterium]|nr:ATP-dependent helicase [Deltaproteobacteria bacterium]